MTKLDDVQQRTLQNLKQSFTDILPVLQKMEEDYEYAVYRAKKPLREAVQSAVDNGVPMKRIALEAAGFKYPQKLNQWLEPSKQMLERLEEDVVLQTSDSFADDIENIKAVVRNPRSGEFEVTYHGDSFTIPAYGPDSEPWSTRDESVPQGVYDLIAGEYPAYVVLEEDD